MNVEFSSAPSFDTYVLETTSENAQVTLSSGSATTWSWSTSLVDKFGDKFSIINLASYDAEKGEGIADTLAITASDLENWTVKSTDEKDVVKVTSDAESAVNLAEKTGFSGTYDLTEAQLSSLSFGANHVLVIADQQKIDGVTGTGVLTISGDEANTFNPDGTTVYTYALDMGSGADTYEPGRGKGVRAAHMDDDGASVIGGYGADYILYARNIVAGSYTADQWTNASAAEAKWVESSESDGTLDNNLYAIRDLGFTYGGTDSRQVMVDSAIKHLEHANVIGATDVAWAESEDSADTPEIDIAFSTGKDTVVLMSGEGKRTAEDTFSSAPAITVNAHAFGVEDAFLLINQQGKLVIDRDGDSTESGDDLNNTATAVLKIASSLTTLNALADSDSVKYIKVSSSDGVLTSDANSLVLNWNKIATDLGESEGNESSGISGNAAFAWGLLTEAYDSSTVETTINFDGLGDGLSLANAYLEVHLSGTFTATGTFDAENNMSAYTDAGAQG